MNLTNEEFCELYDVLLFTIECLEEDDERTEILSSIITKMEVSK